MSENKNKEFMFFLASLLGLIIIIINQSSNWISAHAQNLNSVKTNLAPNTQNEIYNLLLIGDEFADDVSESLQDAFKNDPNLKIGSKNFLLNPSFLKRDDEKINSLEESLKVISPQIALIIIGGTERITLRAPSGKRYNFGSTDWRNEYKERVNTLLKILKKRNTIVYMLSLPPYRNAEENERAKTINDVFRETTFINEMRYIDIYLNFLDDNGRYTAWGPDLDGRIIKIRESDGQGFTKSGKFMLAHFIARELRRDIKEAQAVKFEPLAGLELEQNKINPGKQLIKNPTKYKANTDTIQGLKGNTTYKLSGEEIPADNDKITLASIKKGGREEGVMIDILRPSLSSSIVALLSQKDSEFKKKKISEKLSYRTNNGLILLNTITLPRLEDLEGGKSKLPPTQTAYYKLLVKGERLAPKPGRADESLWPKP